MKKRSCKKSTGRVCAIIIGIALLVILSLALSVPAQAAPSAEHFLDAKKSIWRNYFKDKFFVEMHSLNAISALKNLKFDDPSLDEAVRLRLGGQWQQAIDLMRDQATELDVDRRDKILFTTGLIYESIGFYPEAMGNYSRIDPKMNRDLFLRTLLRKSFVKFINGLNYSSIFDMIDADTGFYKVYKESSDHYLWSNAMAGHAVMLYVFGEHSYAEEIFAKLDTETLLEPTYQFIRIENYLNLGRTSLAEALLIKLQGYVSKELTESLKSYINLRLGDIAAMNGDLMGAEEFFNDIGTETTYDPFGAPSAMDDGFIMKTMAMAELHLKSENYKDSLKLLLQLKGTQLPPKLALETTIPLYMMSIYDRTDRDEEAFGVAKDFLMLYPKSDWAEEAWAYVDQYIFNLFVKAYSEQDYHGVLDAYYENKRFVRKRRALLMAADAMLSSGLPEEGRIVYSELTGRGGNFFDWKASRGLVEALSVVAENDKAAAIVNRMKPRNAEEELIKAESARILAGAYYGGGSYKESQSFYEKALKVIDDAGLHADHGLVLALNGEHKGAAGAYGRALSKAPDDALKARSLIGEGDALFNMKEFKSSLKSYSSAEEFAGADLIGRVLYMKGLSKRRLGKRREALELWKRAVREGAQMDYVTLSKERLKEAEAWEKVRQ